MPEVWEKFFVSLFANIPTTLLAIGAMYAAIVKAKQECVKKVEETKDVTVTAAREHHEEVKSAVREIKDQAKDVASKAEKAAEMATATADKMVTETQSLKDVVNENIVAVNGRLTNKVALARETGHLEGVLEGSQLLSRVESNTTRIDALESKVGDIATDTHAMREILEELKIRRRADQIKPPPIPIREVQK